MYVCSYQPVFCRSLWSNASAWLELRFPLVRNSRTRSRLFAIAASSLYKGVRPNCSVCDSSAYGRLGIISLGCDLCGSEACIPASSSNGCNNRPIQLTHTTHTVHAPSACSRQVSCGLMATRWRHGWKAKNAKGYNVNIIKPYKTDIWAHGSRQAVRYSART